MHWKTMLRLGLALVAFTLFPGPPHPWAAPGAGNGNTIKVWSAANKGVVMTEKIRKSLEDWRKLLTAEQFHVTREKGTEEAFTGRDWDNHGEGIYRCVCCGLDLFASEDKYDSGTGWPSFTAPIAAENVATVIDRSLFMTRTEVICRRCDAHLGHVFDDGPDPNGLRYCMNSAALVFVPKKQIDK